jgi:hypothetical protein
MTKEKTEEKANYDVIFGSARISFPNLFQTAVFGGEDTEKFDCTFILDKVDHADVIKVVQGKIAGLTKDRFKGKALPADRVCFKDGDESDRPEYQGKYTIKASTKTKPKVFDANGKQADELLGLQKAEDLFHAGSYAHGKISLWCQDNQFGKRINANLSGVKYAKDGEYFGAPPVDADEFDVFGDSDEELVF